MSEGQRGVALADVVVRVKRTPASAIAQWDAEYAEAKRVILERLAVLEREGEALKHALVTLLGAE
jgi:hypothetical protein